MKKNLAGRPREMPLLMKPIDKDVDSCEYRVEVRNVTAIAGLEIRVVERIRIVGVIAGSSTVGLSWGRIIVVRLAIVLAIDVCELILRLIREGSGILYRPFIRSRNAALDLRWLWERSGNMPGERYSRLGCSGIRRLKHVKEGREFRSSQR